MKFIKQLLKHWDHEIRRRISNHINASIALNPRGINLNVDATGSVRVPGWYNAATVEEAIEVLVSREVHCMVVNYDLGYLQQNGYSLLSWLDLQLRENNINYWPKYKPVIVDDSPLQMGKKAMDAAIERSGVYTARKKWWLSRATGE